MMTERRLCERLGCVSGTAFARRAADAFVEDRRDNAILWVLRRAQGWSIFHWNGY